jgi:hypothetical protein
VSTRQITALPHSDDMEKGVLSSMLQGKGPVIDKASALESEAFYSPINRKIFIYLVAAHREGMPVDLIAFTESLRNEGVLDEIGGAGYLAELLTFAAADCALDYYIDELRSKWRERELVLLGQRMIQGEMTPEEIRAKLDALIDSNGSLDGLPPIQVVADLISKPIVLPDDVIEGLLHKGGKMVIGGGSKSFKTWQLIDLATAVATGGKYLGFPTRKGRVLYINLELPAPYFSHRCKTVFEVKRASDNGFLEVWNLRGHAAELAKLLPAMLRRAGVDKYALIIIDPIYKLLGEREENVAHHVTAIMNDLEKLTVKSGAAVGFGAHFSKGNQAAKESIDRIGGSGAFARDPDSILILTRHEEDNAFTVEATLRNHPPIESFVVRWRFPMMYRDDKLDPTRLKKATGAPKKVTEQQALDLLKQPMRPREFRDLIVERYLVGPATAERRIKELARAGRIIKVAGYWRHLKTIKTRSDVCDGRRTLDSSHHNL